MKKRTGKTKPAPARVTGGRVKRIVVPFDFSAGAERALEYAVGQARHFKARLTLVHIIHIPYLGSGFGPGEGLGAEDRLLAEAAEQLAAIAARLRRRGVPVESIVRVGHPVRDTADAARRHGADLVIIGTHGRTGLKHVLLGSVAEGMMRHAPCPVLVVR